MLTLMLTPPTSYLYSKLFFCTKLACAVLVSWWSTVRHLFLSVNENYDIYNGCEFIWGYIPTSPLVCYSNRQLIVSTLIVSLLPLFQWTFYNIEVISLFCLFTTWNQKMTTTQIKMKEPGRKKRKKERTKRPTMIEGEREKGQMLNTTDKLCSITHDQYYQ